MSTSPKSRVLRLKKKKKKVPKSQKHIRMCLCFFNQSCSVVALLSVSNMGGDGGGVAGLDGNAICLPTVYCFLWRPSRLILCDTTNPQLVPAGTRFRLGQEKTKSIILIITLTARFIKHTLLLLGL